MRSESEFRSCPFCSEQIRATAKKCKHCGEFIDGEAKSRRSSSRTGAIISSVIAVFFFLAAIGGIPDKLPETLLCAGVGILLLPPVAKRFRYGGEVETLIVVVAVVLLGFYAAVDSGPQAAGSSASQQQQTPQLRVKNWEWHREFDFWKVDGAVTNVTGQKMDGVQVVASYFDDNGNFITSDDSFIDYNPILPGQTSPFSIYATYNPAIAKASIAFKYFAGGTIPSEDKSE